jgi:hypothetical protein
VRTGTIIRARVTRVARRAPFRRPSARAAHGDDSRRDDRRPRPDRRRAARRRAPALSFWQIVNMNVGFFGIQYSFGLQQGNMSPIYRYLGADEAASRCCGSRGR